MKIHAIQYARSSMPESMVFAGGADDKQRDISFLLYVVQTEDHWVLIDAGCDNLPGFILRDFRSPAAALREYGILPEEITDVIITHAHHDHIAGLHHFPHAQIYIQSEEHIKGRTYIPERARVHVFDQSCIVAGCIAVEKIGGHTAGSSIAMVTIGDVQYIFGGDECYLPACLEANIPTGASHDTEASRKFITRFSKPGNRVLLSHDTQIKTGIIIERT